MEQRVLTIKCFDSCVYNLHFPMWFLNATQAHCIKLFKWLFQFGFHHDNQESIAFLSYALPTLIEDTKADWEIKLSEYESGKLSLDKASLPRDWTGKQKVEEIKRRREHNAALLQTVKDVENTHKKSLKLLELYEEEKAKWSR